MVESYINHGRPDKKQNVMDDITYGQWSKNHYSDDDYDDPRLNDDILDPYTTQKSFRKITKKLSKEL
jgi:hypothetical protein